MLEKVEERLEECSDEEPEKIIDEKEKLSEKKDKNAHMNPFEIIISNPSDRSSQNISSKSYVQEHSKLTIIIILIMLITM